MKPTITRPASGSVQSQLDAQSREIEQLKDDAVTKERCSDAVTDDLRLQVSEQQVRIDHLADDAAAQKETTDASTEHLQAQVDSIQQEVDVLAQEVASQGSAIDDIRKESEPEELRHAYAEYLKAVAHDLGDQYRQELETHAETQRKLAEITNTVLGNLGDNAYPQRPSPSVD